MKKFAILTLFALPLTGCSFMNMVSKKCTTTGRANVETGSFEACIKCDSLRPTQINNFRNFYNGR